MADIRDKKENTKKIVIEKLKSMLGDLTKQSSDDIKAMAFGLSYDHLADMGIYSGEDVRILSEEICLEIAKDCK